MSVQVKSFYKAGKQGKNQSTQAFSMPKEDEKIKLSSLYSESNFIFYKKGTH